MNLKTILPQVQKDIADCINKWKRNSGELTPISTLNTTKYIRSFANNPEYRLNIQIRAQT